MSSFYGIFHLQQNNLERSTLINMQQALPHWQVDTKNLWCSEKIGIGQNTVLNSPQSFYEKFPIVEDHFIIAANARIDNKEELKNQLEINRPTKEIGDGWLILQAYKKWKTDCPKYLTGEFSFIIYNSRDQNIFAAKDAFGTRPLYYFNTGNIVLLSSEIERLFASGLVEKKLNDLALALHLIGFKGEKEQTAFQNIYILPAAHWLLISKDDFKIKRYWEVNIYQKLKLKDNREYEEGFRYHLSNAIKRRTQSSYPIGSLLSGGLDSTAINGMLLKDKLYDTPLHIHSWVHPADQKVKQDDRHYIEDFLKTHRNEKIDHQYLHGIDGYFSLLPQWKKYTTEPFRDLEHYTRFQSYQLFQSQNVRTVLSGVGGDQLASSHAREYSLQLLFHFKWLLLTKELNQKKKLGKKTLKSLLKKELIKPLLDLLKREESWGRGNPYSAKFFLVKDLGSSFITEELQKKVCLHGYITEHIDGFQLKLDHLLKRSIKLNLESGQLDISFNQRYHPSLAFGVQYTYPLLDKNLVEYCMSLPVEQFHQNGHARSLIRRSMKAYVPNSILERTTKFPTSPNFEQRIIDEVPLLEHKLKKWKSNTHINKRIDLVNLGNFLQLLKSGEQTINPTFLLTIIMIYFLEEN